MECQNKAIKKVFHTHKSNKSQMIIKWSNRKQCPRRQNENYTQKKNQ